MALHGLLDRVQGNLEHVSLLGNLFFEEAHLMDPLADQAFKAIDDLGVERMVSLNFVDLLD
jgi:hypothetical protein